jgi:serine/threonine-protein kinase RsbW
MKEGFMVVSELILSSDYQSLIDVEKLIGEVCQELGIHEEAFGNVLIAVTEAVNNAIQHGNQANASLKVTLIVSNSKDTFCIQVQDEGKGFDYTSLPDPTAPENIFKESGRGVFLMNNLADELEFVGNGNTVNLYFNK